MAIDLECAVIYAPWLTIIGDTIAVLYEQCQNEEEDNGKTK